MELKVICPCGTKYKFDVVPVNGRMPIAVACPVCGADGTEQANELLGQSPPSAPVSILIAPGPVAQAVPVVAPAVPPPLPSGGLRINRAAELPPPIAPRANAPSPIGSISQGAAKTNAKGPSSEKLKRALAIGVVCLTVLGIGFKWFRRIRSVVRVASVVGATAAASQGGSDDGAKNLWYENCSMLFVKHTNHMEIAEACKSYWKEKLHRTLSVSQTDQEAEEKGEYQLIPAHNGWVRILGAFEWPPEQLEGLAADLSEKFGTQAFEWRSESFADTYHFGVYEQGARKFHARMDIKSKGDDADEVVTAEGKDWAMANGYRGKADFKEFNVLDADRITRQLGMKLWDEQEGAEIKGVLMKETANK
jgi:hypothetical protein